MDGGEGFGHCAGGEGGRIDGVDDFDGDEDGAFLRQDVFQGKGEVFQVVDAVD